MEPLRSSNTQVIFTCFLILFSLIILLHFPFTSNYLQTIITPSSSTFSSQLTPLSSVILARNDSGSVVASQKVTPLPTRIGSGHAGPEDDHEKEISVHENRVGNGSGRIREKKGSCDMFDGKWVLDDEKKGSGSDPVYPPGSCPYLDDGFNCFNNGRPDLGYLKYRWQPHGCDIPRFDGKKMLEMLRGKRMVFVGDSLNRNMWEAMVCALRMSLVDKTRVFEVNGKRQFRTAGFYSFKFMDYNCSIEFIRSPFLVQQWKLPRSVGVEEGGETLRLDMIQATTSKYNDADFLIFNTGHWWTHSKTKDGVNFYQEGNVVHKKLKVKEAYTKAIETWAKWVDKNVNKRKTKVFFVGYSSSHFRGGQWNSGGNCDGQTEPITNDKFLAPYPWMMKSFESVMSKMKTPVLYLNISKLTGYRKDGHPSIYGHPANERRPGMAQDCSHWCLPGVPDSWNQLLYASLLLSSNVVSSRTH